MLASEIIQSSIPVLHAEDTVEEAIQLMQDNNLEELPLLNNDIYEGLLGMDDLLNADETATLDTLSAKLNPVSIDAGEHVLTALKLINQFSVTVLPVLSQNKEYLGVITERTIIQALNTLLGCDYPGALFVVEMPRQKFSVGEICRLVETNDAFVTQFNTYMDNLSGLVIATFKINKTEISDVLATLQRYEYAVRYYFGEELFENDLKENFENLMTYLNV